MLFAYVLDISYLGALVAHDGAGLACVGCLLCNGAVWPGLRGPTELIFLHRLAALGAAALVMAVWVGARKCGDGHPSLYRAARAAAIVIALQMGSGAHLVLSDLSLGADLIHVALMTILFALVAYMALEPLPRGTSASPLNDVLEDPSAYRPTGEGPANERRKTPAPS